MPKAIQFEDAKREFITNFTKPELRQVAEANLDELVRLHHTEMIWDMLEANYNNRTSLMSYEQKANAVGLILKGWMFETAIRAATEDESKTPTEEDYKDKRTSAEWAQDFPLVVINHDGWDRSNFTFSWFEEKITREEFELRVAKSTCVKRWDR